MRHDISELKELRDRVQELKANCGTLSHVLLWTMDKLEAIYGASDGTRIESESDLKNYKDYVTHFEVYIDYMNADINRSVESLLPVLSRVHANIKKSRDE